MLIENRSCDECGRHCGYLVILGHGPRSAYLCVDCLRKGREEIIAVMAGEAEIERHFAGDANLDALFDLETDT